VSSEETLGAPVSAEGKGGIEGESLKTEIGNAPIKITGPNHPGKGFCTRGKGNGKGTDNIGGEIKK